MKLCPEDEQRGRCAVVLKLCSEQSQTHDGSELRKRGRGVGIGEGKGKGSQTEREREEREGER